MSMVLSVFLSAVLLRVMLRILAKDEADPSLLRYPVFGACYWLVAWVGVLTLRWEICTLVPLVAFTIYALCQFFYVTIAKSCWLAVLFVALRSLLDLALAMGVENLAGSSS